MNRWAAFESLCALLAPAGAPLPHEVSQWDWNALVALASEHLVTPALTRRVAGLTTAPEAASQYFATIHALNARRNAVILDAIAAVTSGLHEVGIEAVLLKGAASLVTGLYDDPAERMVGDIDLLVRPTDIDAAARRLDALGYRMRERAPRWVYPAYVRHIPVMVHQETGVGVEIHENLVTPTLELLLPAADVFVRAHRITWQGREVLVPGPTHRVIHNIVHDQVLHGRFAEGTTELRQLLELARLASRHADAIDWPDVEQRFDRAKHGHVLRNQAAICGALMRVDMPVGAKSTAGAVSRLAAAMQSPLPISGKSKLRRLMQVYIGGCIANPRLALNLLNPFWWPERIRGIRHFFANE